jgi:hypothetical protein
LSRTTCLTQPRLRYAIIAHFGPGHADDLVPEAKVSIIERADADPPTSFAPACRAGDALRRELVHHKHATPLEEADERPADGPDPLEAIAVRQTIAAGPAAGRRRKEIAEDLGIRSQSLTWHYGKLRQALVGAA